MPDLFLIVAVGLMILAVVGSVVPMIPGALLSIAGILLYWWSTGYTAPGPIFLAAFVGIGILAVAADHLSGVIGAKYGGASTRNSVIAGVTGVILFFVLGPIGIVLGVAGTVFVLEFLDSKDQHSSLRAATYAVVGVIGSTVIQFTVTLSLLIAFMIALLL